MHTNGSHVNPARRPLFLPPEIDWETLPAEVRARRSMTWLPRSTKLEKLRKLFFVRSLILTQWARP
jgi:hypothetical protein